MQLRTLGIEPGCARHRTGRFSALSVRGPACQFFRQGPVRVIVELQGRFEVEGSLVTPQAAQAQRDVIAALQDGVLHTMATHNVSSVKRFTYIPYLAMEVDAVALEALRASPEVVSDV